MNKEELELQLKQLEDSYISTYNLYSEAIVTAKDFDKKRNDLHDVLVGMVTQLVDNMHLQTALMKEYYGLLDEGNTGEKIE